MWGAQFVSIRPYERSYVERSLADDVIQFIWSVYLIYGCYTYYWQGYEAV
jgi:hypothetical protein